MHCCQLLMCRLGNSEWGPYMLCAMTLCYFLSFLFYVALGFYQLRSRPYHEMRTAVILFRLQARHTSSAPYMIRLGKLLYQQAWWDHFCGCLCCPCCPVHVQWSDQHLIAFPTLTRS